MKKILITLSLAALALLPASAQKKQSERVLHINALQMAEQIGVAEADEDAFVALYQDYKKELADITRTKPEVKGEGEDAVEAKILADFDKSERILAVRKAYYPRFRAILLPSQIQKMYFLDRGARRGDIRPGFPGPGHPAEPMGGGPGFDRHQGQGFSGQRGPGAQGRGFGGQRGSGGQGRGGQNRGD